jgi:ribose-phosphate pyrophosphokinase
MTGNKTGGGTLTTAKPLNGDLKIISGSANPELSREIADDLRVHLSDICISRFADSETHVQIEESVRGKDLYIIQPTCPPVNENLMELLITIDACRRASARQITAVIPYYGYARQDHKSTGREPISAKLVADLIATSGADRVVSVDLHAAAIQGFFNVPMDHLTAVPILAGYFKGKAFRNAVIVAPDAGRAKLAEKYTDILQLPLAVMTKRRKGIGGKELKFNSIMGDVEGKKAIIIDDVITSGSITEEAEMLIDAGAEEVYLSITHAILAPKAIERLQSPAVKGLITTNTVPVGLEKQLDGKVKLLSIAPLLAKVIRSIHQNRSVSQLFLKENIVFPV